MPKLLRLLGDSVKSSTEIRNTFRQPIIVGPNAKVALVGISTFLTDEIANEKYIIDDNNNQFKIGTDIINNPDLVTATITNGDYTPQQLLREMSKAANLTGTDTSGIGDHHSFISKQNYVNIETHNSDPSNPAMFTNWINTTFPAFSYTATDTSVLFTGTTLLKDKYAVVPMVHSQFSATLNNANTHRVALYAQGGVSTYAMPNGDRYGVDVSGGNYYGLINESSINLSQSASANDQVIIEIFDRNVKITVNDSAGAFKFTWSSIDSVKVKYYEGQPLSWGVFGSPGTGVSNATCTRLTNYPTTDKHSLTDNHSFAGIRFVNASNVTNTQLELYLGFPSAGNGIQKYAGNPAVLEATSHMKGLPQYPGILVVVDGLGAFQSFDGASTSRSQDNIIYVLHDLSVVNANIIQLDVPAPFFLDINNSNAINVNELRIRLLPASGQESNPVLTFTGKPCVTLLIED